MAKACDVKYINFKDVHVPRTDSPEALKAARAKTEAAGLTIMGGGTITWVQKGPTGSRATPSRFARTSSTPSSMGMPLIVAAPSFEALDTVEKTAKEFDIKVAIHNHGPEDKFFPSPYNVYKHIKGRDKHMGMCVDIGHTWRASVDPTKAVLEFHDRVYDLHVKDLSDLNKRDSQVIVGKGAIDFPALFRALVKISYHGARRARVPDRRRQSAAGDAAVVRLHARCPGGNQADVTRPARENNRRFQDADISETGNLGVTAAAIAMVAAGLVARSRRPAGLSSRQPAFLSRLEDGAAGDRDHRREDSSVLPHRRSPTRRRSSKPSAHPFASSRCSRAWRRRGAWRSCRTATC